MRVDAAARAATAAPGKRDFYNGMAIALDGAIDFQRRYAALARAMAADRAHAEHRASLEEVARVCDKLSREPPSTFREAVQALWFLFVLLQAESNASSFSPGRADQYLYPYYKRDIESGALSDAEALEIIEALWLKFNQIVYLRNSSSARYFAGFPIGFNIAIGGLDERGEDAANELSFLFLRAQAHIGLPQPNAFVWKPDE